MSTAPTLSTNLEADNPSSATTATTSALHTLWRTAYRWGRVFWPLVLTLWAGFVVFPDAIMDSIRSTPHPQLVYGIFAVAGVTAVILAYLMQVFVSEHAWLESLEQATEAQQLQRMKTHEGDHSLKAVYHLLVQTRGLDLRERQVALENEMMGAESHLMARLAVPNFLAGALVGLGLVGTFIGLLGALQDLSGVFSAMTGGGGGSDPTAMFTTMIERLKAPMQGMGTAFVASLYGLLGSLVLGLISSGVKRTGDRMLGHLRVHVNDDIYAAGHSANLPTSAGKRGVVVTSANPSVLTIDPSPAIEAVGQTLSRVMQEQQSSLVRAMNAQQESLTAVLKEQQRDMALMLGQLVQSQEKIRVDIGNLQARFSELTQSGQRRSEEHQKATDRLVQANATLAEALTALRGELQVSSVKGVWLIGRSGMALLGGAIVAALALLVAQFGAPRTAMPRPAPATTTTAAESASAVASAATADTASTASTAIAPVMDTSAPLAQPEQATSAAPAATVVASGDSLWRIAKQHGTTIDALLKANPELSVSSHLMPGQIVLLPETSH